MNPCDLLVGATWNPLFTPLFFQEILYYYSIII
jgi:hypothetical protein